MNWRCRLGLHRKVDRLDDEAVRTFIATGVSISKCTRCPWYMKGIHEG